MLRKAVVEILVFIKTSSLAKFELFISKIERGTSISVGQVKSKSQINNIFKFQNLWQFFRYGPAFMNLNFLGFKITFCTIWSQRALSLISGGYELIFWNLTNDRVKLMLWFSVPCFRKENHCCKGLCLNHKICMKWHYLTIKY